MFGNGRRTSSEDHVDAAFPLRAAEACKGPPTFYWLQLLLHIEPLPDIQILRLPQILPLRQSL